MNPNHIHTLITLILYFFSLPRKLWLLERASTLPYINIALSCYAIRCNYSLCGLYTNCLVLYLPSRINRCIQFTAINPNIVMSHRCHHCRCQLPLLPDFSAGQIGAWSFYALLALPFSLLLKVYFTSQSTSYNLIKNSFNCIHLTSLSNGAIFVPYIHGLSTVPFLESNFPTSQNPPSGGVIRPVSSSSTANCM